MPSAACAGLAAVALRLPYSVASPVHRTEITTEGGDVNAEQALMAIAALALALTLSAPGAEARRGADNPPEPPECQIEDGGVLVCK